jgi:tRNA nucleotidyltransferase (CCA-adding enzyme)
MNFKRTFRLFTNLITLVMTLKPAFKLKYFTFIILRSLKGQVKPFYMELPDHVKLVIATLHANGLTPLIVGGSVRDQFYGDQVKDIDIEVYGTSISNLLELLKTIEGVEKVDIFGARFGVIKIFWKDGLDLDISVPRIDNKTGKGKTGFDTDFDPDMMPNIGALRRDYTLNAMAYDPRGLLLDFNGGSFDIQNSVLRATSNKFEEDPTRIYRGLQFASRKNLTVDPQTGTRVSNMLADHDDIKSEMIWEEWKKFFLKGIYFKAGFKFLEDTQLGSLYPEIMNLKGCLQQEEWHPEGDVWIHTILVLEAMQKICNREEIHGVDKLVLMLACICHDFGKPATTRLEEGKWRAKGHCEEGVLPTTQFLRRINCPDSIAKKVIPLVASHLDHSSFVGRKPSRSALGKIKQRIFPATIAELVLLVEADSSGRFPLPPKSPISNWVQLEEEYGLNTPKFTPLLSGKDLISIGLKPGKIFSQIISVSSEAELNGEFNNHDEALLWLDSYLKNNSIK